MFKYFLHHHPLCPCLTLVSTLIKSLDADNDSPVNIPGENQDFKDVFSKIKACGLPRHCPHDCVIDLRPGASLLLSHLYPLSLSEQKATEDYVQEALQQGYI